MAGEGGSGGVRGWEPRGQILVKQSGAGGTLTPADRHGSVQVSLPAHLPLSCHSLDFPEASPFFSIFLHLLVYFLPIHLQSRYENATFLAMRL